MKKWLAAGMMVLALAACSQETKQEVKDAAQSAASDVKNAASEAKSAAVSAASDAKQAARAAASDAKASAGEVKDAAKAAASDAKAAAQNVKSDAEKAAAEKAGFPGLFSGKTGAGNHFPRQPTKRIYFFYFSIQTTPARDGVSRPVRGHFLCAERSALWQRKAIPAARNV